MTTRMRWLLLAGVVLVGVFGLWSIWLSRVPASTIVSIPHLQPARSVPRYQGWKPPFTETQFVQFLVSAHNAEAIFDPLQRCLAYPDPPGLTWSKVVTAAYCHYQFDSAIKPDEMRRLIQAGQAAELDRRLAGLMHAQLAQPGEQGILDRTFNIDFANGPEDVRALVDAWKRQSPDSPFALAASGTVYVAMAQHARGANYADKTQQSSFDAMRLLLQEARADLDAAVKRDSRVTPAYGAMIYAAALDSDGRYAMDAARRGLAVDPSNYTIYARLVWMAQPKWGGNPQLMKSVVDAAQQHAGQNALLQLLLSERTGGESQVEDCACTTVEDFDLYRLLFGQPATVGMLMSAGWAAEHRNMPRLSVIYRSELLRFDPAKIDHRQSRAFTLARLGQKDWALSEGNALVALRPQDENSYEARGFAFELAGQIDSAIKDYEQALRLNPDDAWGLARLGWLDVHAKRNWDEGWVIANRLIQAHPDDPQGWMLRANIQKDQPRAGLDQAISDFVARFGNDPANRAEVAAMEAMRLRPGMANGGH